MRPLVLKLALILLPGIITAQSLPENVVKEVKRRSESEINPNISIGLLLPSGETQFYNYGQSDVDSTTLYEIGSVTKTFTSTLAQQYLPHRLYRRISDFFPDSSLNPSLKMISINDLRNHVSGLPRLSGQFAPADWSDPFKGYTDSILMEELKHVQQETPNQWSYSNFGYGLLGKVLEQETGEDFEGLMSKLLNKANMDHTYMDHDLPQEVQLTQPTNIGTDNSYWHFEGPSRYAGGLLSCTQDLINYLKYQKDNNPMFDEENKLEGIQTGIEAFGKDRLFFLDGWFVFKPYDDKEILLHNGGTGGYTSFVAFNKKNRTGVVVLSNSVSLVDDIGMKLIYPAFELQKPKRTIAYELADMIDNGNADSLMNAYRHYKKEGMPDDVLDIYWMERYNFGKGNYPISNQLSDIMVALLPDDWEVMDIKGQNLEKLEQYEAAKKAYERALALNPKSQRLKDKIKACKDKMP